MGTRLEGGHTDTVLSVTVTNGPTSRIVSGGENGELCVWAPDGSTQEKCQLGDCDVTSLACSQRTPDIIFAACGSKIHKLDVRQLNQAIDVFDFNEEEINQVTINEKEEFLAACDDSGHVKVINLQEKRVFKTLRKHTNICATLCFRPKRPWDLITGGYDSKLMQWDFSRGRSYCNMSMEDLGQPPEEVESYLVSPPFVHNLSMSRDGDLLACGTENALVHVFSASKKNLAFLKTFRGHTRGVSQVHFPAFQDSVLVSGGNDGKVMFWDMTADSENSPVNCNGVGHAGEEATPNPAPPIVPPRYHIEHSAKINWLTTGVSPGNQQFVVVADNSSSLTLYPFPE